MALGKACRNALGRVSARYPLSFSFGTLLDGETMQAASVAEDCRYIDMFTDASLQWASATREKITGPTSLHLNVTVVNFMGLSNQKCDVLLLIMIAGKKSRPPRR